MDSDNKNRDKTDYMQGKDGKERERIKPASFYVKTVSDNELLRIPLPVVKRKEKKEEVLSSLT